MAPSSERRGVEKHRSGHAVEQAPAQRSVIVSTSADLLGFEVEEKNSVRLKVLPTPISPKLHCNRERPPGGCIEDDGNWRRVSASDSRRDTLNDGISRLKLLASMPSLRAANERQADVASHDQLLAIIF